MTITLGYILNVGYLYIYYFMNSLVGDNFKPNCKNKFNSNPFFYFYFTLSPLEYYFSQENCLDYQNKKKSEMINKLCNRLSLFR